MFISSQADREVPLKNTEDGLTYQNFMHAVYKQEGLPYIPEYAQPGERMMQQQSGAEFFYKYEV